MDRKLIVHDARIRTETQQRMNLYKYMELCLYDNNEHKGCGLYEIRARGKIGST